MKQKTAVFVALGTLLAMSPLRAMAHGSFDILISSTASGGGALKAEYDFAGVSRVDYTTTLGGNAIYTGIEPAFDLLAADEPLESSYVLTAGTEVSLQITGIDAGKTSVKIDTTVLSAVGNSVSFGTVPFAHTHPQLQLQLALPEGEFGEGSISFKLTSTTPAYSESEIYTLKISNGPLAHFDYDPGTYASKSVACQQLVGAQVSSFTKKRFTYLRACLDKVQVYAAKAALTTPPATLTAAQKAAEKACADASGTGPDAKTMLGKIAAAQAAAFTAIKKKCGTPNPPTVPATASGDLADDDITQLLGLAACRTDELAAGTYGGAREHFATYTARASQGGNALDTYFPCLFATASE